jgi:hypothetical protein
MVRYQLSIRCALAARTSQQGSAQSGACRLAAQLLFPAASCHRMQTVRTCCTHCVAVAVVTFLGFELRYRSRWASAAAGGDVDVVQRMHAGVQGNAAALLGGDCYPPELSRLYGVFWQIQSWLPLVMLRVACHTRCLVG